MQFCSSNLMSTVRPAVGINYNVDMSFRFPVILFFSPPHFISTPYWHA